jgi:flagellar hook protein FlgE
MLNSVLNSSLSGMSAANVAVNITANNLANSLTDGFKASRPVFTDQTPQTHDHGSGPGTSSAGQNPTQVGSGVSVATIARDTSQGTLTLSNDPLDLALEGDGLFVVQGPGGEQLYTRDGQFQFNANGDLVSSTGMNVLGYNVDHNFDLDTSKLEPVRVPRDQASSGAIWTSLTVGEDGTVRGEFSDGVIRDLGQVQLAEFANPGGLAQRGQNTYSTSANSSLPRYSSAGGTRVVSGARELSNTNIARELVNLSLYSTTFRANLRAAEVGGEMLEELFRLGRS